MNPALAFWAFAAGALIPVMAALNGGLGRALGSGPWATVVLFAVGLCASLAVALAAGGPAPLQLLGQGRPAQYLGGLIVAFYVLSVTFLAPRLGVGTTILCAVMAQIVTSALIGHFGWLGAPRQPLDLLRLAGLALMAGGLALTQLRGLRA